MTFNVTSLFVASQSEERRGLDIKQTLDEYYPNKINHGRLHPNLDDLVERDFLEKEKIEDRTNAYSLTDEGRQLVKERREWENDIVGEQPNLAISR